MGYIHGGGLQTLVQCLDLGTHGHTQFGIQVGKRLVKKKDFRVTHDGTAHGHALALPTRKFARKAVKQRVKVQNSRCVTNALVGKCRICLAQLQAESHVVAHRHVRVKRVALEHHGNVTVFGIEVVDDLAVDGDLAPRDFLQTCQHPQQG